MAWSEMENIGPAACNFSAFRFEVTCLGYSRSLTRMAMVSGSDKGKSPDPQSQQLALAYPKVGRVQQLFLGSRQLFHPI